MADDYSKLTITSKKDRYSHGFSIPDYERDMKAIVNQAVKSALSEGSYFRTSSRVVDRATGETKLDIYVHSADEKVVSDSIRNELNKLTFRDKRGKLTQRPKYKMDVGVVTEKEIKALAREEKGETEVTRFNKGIMLKVIGLLTSIADITRRILSSVLTFSSQALRDTITAHNLGMSYEAVRAYRHTEAQHGLKEGTIVEAVAGEQQKYGNITSLDEKSLEYIALIMGSKVEEMATMGIGASNPEAIVEAIVDRANELANAGYNSIGQYVGEQQARRELYSYLLKYSPQIADIFATMQEEQHNINSLFKNQASTFAEWKNVLPTKRGNISSAEYNIPATVGQEWNVVKDIYEQIKEGIKISLAPWILSLLRRLENVRWGMTDRESKQLDEEHREANEEFINSAKVQLSTLTDSEADKQRALALNYYIEKAEKENNKKDKVGYVVPTADEIVVKGQELAETAIRFRVATKQEKFSPEMKYVVDTYLDEKTREDFFSKQRQEALAKARKDSNDKIKATEKRREEDFKAQAVAMTEDKSSPYYVPDYKLVDKGIALAMADVELYFGDTMKQKGEWEEWTKLKNIHKKKAWAVAHGYAGYYSNDRVQSIPHALIPENAFSMSDSEKQALYKIIVGLEGNISEEDLYEALYNEYISKLSGYLANELVYQAKEKAKEGTPAYDLNELQKKYGYDLSGLSSVLGAGAHGSIISNATEGAGGIVTHRIVFDLNNNGKVEASDVLLESYTTNRVSDVGTVVNEVNVTNGKVYFNQAQGTPASKGR